MGALKSANGLGHLQAPALYLPFEVEHLTFDNPLFATLGRTLANPEAKSNCSDGVTADYGECNSTQDMKQETSDGQVRRKKRSSNSKIPKKDQEENISRMCCCTLTISIAGEYYKTLSRVFTI